MNSTDFAAWLDRHLLLRQMDEEQLHAALEMSKQQNWQEGLEEIPKEIDRRQREKAARKNKIS